MNRRTSLTALAVISLTLAWPARALEVGDAAPQFRGRGLQEARTLALADYRGKVVFLDFWASWCPPCLSSLPQLDALRREFPASQFQVLAVNVDREPEKARRFLARRPVGYPSVSDPEARLPEQFEIGTMPTSFLIDAQGVIRYVHEGFREGDVERLRAEIRKLVRAAPAARTQRGAP